MVNHATLQGTILLIYLQVPIWQDPDVCLWASSTNSRTNNSLRLFNTRILIAIVFHSLFYCISIQQGYELTTFNIQHILYSLHIEVEIWYSDNGLHQALTNHQLNVHKNSLVFQQKTMRTEIQTIPNPFKLCHCYLPQISIAGMQKLVNKLRCQASCSAIMTRSCLNGVRTSDNTDTSHFSEAAENEYQRRKGWEQSTRNKTMWMLKEHA